MLNIKSFKDSLNVYDIFILFFINIAMLETLSYSYGLAAISGTIDIFYPRMILFLTQREPVHAVVVFLHLFLVSLSALAAIRYPVREIPDLVSALFEAFNGAVLVAFINIFLFRQNESFWSNLWLALGSAFIFFFCRWILPRSPLKVRVPFAGVLLSTLWLLSALIVIRYYMANGDFIPAQTINDIGVFKDAFLIWVILFIVGLIPQLIHVDKRFHAVIFFFVGIISLMALFFEFLYPLIGIGRSMARSVLEYTLETRDISVALLNRFVQTMLWHVIVRSFVILFLGVVMVFILGHIKRGPGWFLPKKDKV